MLYTTTANERWMPVPSCDSHKITGEKEEEEEEEEKTSGHAPAGCVESGWLRSHCHEQKARKWK